MVIYLYNQRKNSKGDYSRSARSSEMTPISSAPPDGGEGVCHRIKLACDAQNLTWNLKRSSLWIAVLFEGPRFRFHVSFSQYQHRLQRAKHPLLPGSIGQAAPTPAWLPTLPQTEPEKGPFEKDGHFFGRVLGHQTPKLSIDSKGSSASACSGSEVASRPRPCKDMSAMVKTPYVRPRSPL